VRETDLWERLTAALGPAYATVWADQVALPALGSRTVNEALKAGLPYKTIWRAAWEWLELAPRER